MALDLVRKKIVNVSFFSVFIFSVYTKLLIVELESIYNLIVLRSESSSCDPSPHLFSLSHERGSARCASLVP